ncbi:Glyoxalase family protein [Indibacter alkaliphilus LW1]|jgi:predicted lactoylglutathione lyase|uniref:Glyoxalase family protein n=1 Tax=Indibacter alkaliphilus (strain CCUG 57479 / KCTC 22604 / LW1) TaxID=1189612 RepID=S2DMH3_INDAL|nr:VOC family protein [Indibacter alkaliphilus]EOZ98400.1 Glyoxalase family protein [Indibacter alkaliphilus LW1]
MIKQIYLNLPVKDLTKSMDFFSHLGFKFNNQFTDETAACMVLGENIFVMLLTEEKFSQFTDRKIADGHQTSEMLIAIDAPSRKAVDEMVIKALEVGASLYSKPKDHGWMYQNAFADLDGHQWEVLFMDEEALRKQTA